jgi:hypothetical protein
VELALRGRERWLSFRHIECVLKSYCIATVCIICVPTAKVVVSVDDWVVSAENALVTIFVYLHQNAKVNVKKNSSERVV